MYKKNITACKIKYISILELKLSTALSSVIAFCIHIVMSHIVGMLHICSNVQKDFVTSLFTCVPYIEYYLRNAYLCGQLIVEHIKFSVSTGL